jgi:phenylpyruvate tautomerase PptA (4-oxalocrotonate tautomerase family)
VVVVVAATSAPTAVEVSRADRAWVQVVVEAVPPQAGPPAGEGPAEAAEEAHEVEGADDEDEDGGFDDA